MKTFNFTTKQKGYGRQGLYFSFNGADSLVTDVFPNIAEHFCDYELSDDCFYSEETDTYTNSNGDEVTPINSWDEFLTERFNEEIGQILYENINLEYFDFDFENATYDEIAKFALNY